MHSILLVVSLLVAARDPAQSSKLDTLTPAQAISRAAASSQPVRAVFQFKVQSAAAAHGGYYLNSEKDYHSPANLELTVRPSAMPGLTQRFGKDLRAALVGKTVKVIGQVHRRAVAGGKSTTTEVLVTHAGQILSAG